MSDLSVQLAQFTGTEQYHFNHLYRWLKYTDGVQYFAVEAGAYWFLDIVGTELRSAAHFRGFLCITLTVDSEKKAVIKATDGDDEELWSRTIDWTNCPAGDYKFFLCDEVLMLSSEY